MKRVLHQARRADLLRDIDLHSSLFLSELATKPSDELLLAVALVSRAVGDGHICLPLSAVAGKQVFPPEIKCQAADLPRWRDKLLDSGVVGQSGANEPLILDEHDKLYMAKYYRCETIIANDLLKRSRGLLPVNHDDLSALTSRLFNDKQEEDWQKTAAAVCALKRFVVISGGPGTGKTTTVARILALLQSLYRGTLRIGLVAPTGKAAVRLQESITSARKLLDEDLAAMVPVETGTLHRLLGYMPGRGSFRYNSSNKLMHDLLVLDEASMVDVPLMASLIDALPEKTRLIMLGDRDQLTSVEAGSLFGDICSIRNPDWSSPLCEQVRQISGWAPESGGEDETFGDSVVLLKKSYRFTAGEGINELAGVVNRGEGERIQGLKEKVYGDLVLVTGDFRQQLEKDILEGFWSCFNAGNVVDALRFMSEFRILCAVREGQNGVEKINLLTEGIFRKNSMIKSADQWYKGRPIIIRRNHYGLQLFNGDTGIVWPDDEGKLWAWFNKTDGSLHKVSLSRLPEHDTAYAITVHQSQGSEFSEVLFLFPETDNRVLCKELLYTGITRARNKLLLYGDEELLMTVAARRVVRHSGLPQKLWGKTFGKSD